MLFFLSLILVGEIPLPNLHLCRFQNDVGLFGASNSLAYHWSLSGDLLQTIDVGEGYVTGVTLYNGNYLISMATEEDEFTLIFGAGGEQLGPAGPFVRQFWRIGDQLFGSFVAPNLKRGRYIWQASRLEIKPVIDGLTLAEVPGFGFAKIQHPLSYEFKSLWFWIQENGTILGVHQMVPAILVYSPKTRERERREGVQVPSEVPGIFLENLPNYKQPPTRSYQVTQIKTVTEARSDYMEWYRSFSRIQWFGAYGNGFLLAYGDSVTNGFVLLGPAPEFEVSPFTPVDGEVIGASGSTVYVWNRHDKKIILLTP